MGSIPVAGANRKEPKGSFSVGTLMVERNHFKLQVPRVCTLLVQLDQLAKRGEGSIPVMYISFNCV